MVLFHLFFLLCTTIRPKIRVLIDLFLLFAHDHSTKMYGPLSYILPLCTIIRPKTRVLIDLFLLFVQDYSTKIRVQCYSLIYSFHNCANISYAIFMAALPLYFVRYTHVQYCPCISYAIFMTIWSLSPGLSPQNCLYFQGFRRSKLFSAGFVVWPRNLYLRGVQ